MKSILGCVKIFLIEQAREPIGIFWSFGAPVGYLAISSSSGSGDIVGHYSDQIGLCLSYISMTTSLFGFGLYLVGRRESGFVRSFLTSSLRRRRFFVAQYVASLVMSLAYGAAFIVLASVFIKQMPMKEASLYFGIYAVICSFFMFGSAIMAALPLTFRSASSLLSIVVTVALVAGISVSANSSRWEILEFANPFFFGSRLISGNLHDKKAILAIFLHLLLILSLGSLGIMKQRINPQWSSR